MTSEIDLVNGNERKIIIVVDATPSLGTRNFVELYNNYLTTILQKLVLEKEMQQVRKS